MEYKNIIAGIIGIGMTFSLISCQTTIDKQNANPELSKSEHLVMATAWYQRSAEMRACYYQTFNYASLRLENITKDNQSKKPLAVILDIDETIMDNSPFEAHLINTGQWYTSTLWKEWTDQEKAKALPGALAFTKKAKAMHVEVFYISNRKVNELQSTIKNMKALGFPNAEGKFIQMKSESSDKTLRRKNISDKYEIALYIGDNLTDFDQAFAHRDSLLAFDLVDEHKNLFGNKYIILPNPMYGEWEGAIYGNNYKLSADEKTTLRKGILQAYE